MTQIRICGAGGQGIVLAGILLGHAGMLDGKNSAHACSYGAEARGSACRSEVVLDTEWIDFPHVTETDILVVMSQQGYASFREGVRPEKGMILFDSGLVKLDDGEPIPHHAVPATEIAANKLGRRMVANMVMLGALSAITGAVTRTSLEKALEGNLGSGIVEVNQGALAAGFGVGENLRV